MFWISIIVDYYNNNNIYCIACVPENLALLQTKILCDFLYPSRIIGLNCRPYQMIK